MQYWFAALVGVLFAAGFYNMLRRSIVRTIIGLTLLSHATHVLIFSASGMVPQRPPLISELEDALLPPFADPLAQALILTALVINFGLTAFLIALVYRTHQTVGTDDMDDLVESDR